MLASGHLKQLFPKSKFILAVRDPVDHITIPRIYDPEVFSFLGYEETTYNDMPIEMKARFWRSAYRSALQGVFHHYDFDDVLIVRYEDLCGDTLGTLQKLFDFVGEENPNECCAFVSKQDDYRQGYRTFTEERIQQVQTITRNVREQFGYKNGLS